MSSSELDVILQQRERMYGNFMRSASIAADLKGILRAYIEWDERLQPDQREALDFIMSKVARIINGDPFIADNWYDIAGYAQLVANRLRDAGI